MISLISHVLLLRDIEELLTWFGTSCLDHLSEHTEFAILIKLGDGGVGFISCKKLEWMVKFFGETTIHNKDPIRVNNSRKPMRNNNNSTISKALLQLFLNEIIRLQINVRSRLIKNKNLSLSKNGSSQTEKLLLTHREDRVVFGDLGVKFLFHVVDVAEEFYFV